MNLGLSVAETVARTREAIARLRLEHLVSRDPLRLSGGQAQLVAIASLLAMRPRHIILDEPTAQLDPAGTRLVEAALRSLAGTGTSLLIAEHKTDLLDRLCSRIVAIDGGRIVLDGPTAATFEDPRLTDLGVEPPARARLGRALAERGVDPAVVDDAITAAAVTPDAAEAMP
jgi:energy-coupling factor transport system ATP-binding protein